MIKDYKSELQALLDAKWHNDYLRKLAIHDHLVECEALYQAYKLSAINPHFTKEQLEQELFKELVDLNILLDMCRLKAGDELYYKRLKRFDEKLEGKSVF